MSSHRPRMLFLPKHTPKGASSHYRVSSVNVADSILRDVVAITCDPYSSTVIRPTDPKTFEEFTARSCEIRNQGRSKMRASAHEWFGLVVVEQDCPQIHAQLGKSARWL